MEWVREINELPTSFDLRVKSNRIKRTFIFNAVSGDKSVAQRAIILNAIAQGQGIIRNIPASRDIESCIAILHSLGVTFARDQNNLIIQGVGLRGLRQPDARLEIGNTATSARLIMSVLAGHPYKVTLSGNPILSMRPMDWVAQPLIEMGATITFLEKPGGLPVIIQGNYPLQPIDINATVASAQEKSAILFAGLYTHGLTSYKQICQSRDHTERLMKYFGIKIETDDNLTTIKGGSEFAAKEVIIPGDISSAAFLLAAYAIRDPEFKEDLLIKDVGVNPTRLGFVNLMNQMGLNISLHRQRMLISNEPIADISCHAGHRPRPGYAEGDALVQSFIDEVPLLAAVSACADGVSIIKNCQELKDKDTNRLETTAKVLSSFGIDVIYNEDEIRIIGGKPLVPAEVDSYGDHRMAMTAAVLASSLDKPSIIRNCGCISVSYSGFLQDLAQFADIEILKK